MPFRPFSILAVAAEVEVVPPAQSPGDIILEKFRQLDWNSFGSEQWQYIGMYYGLRALLVLILLFLAWTISSWLSMAVGSTLRRVKFDETLTKFISKFVRWTILILTALACLSTFGVETTSFAAVIGAAGLAIGLAFQGTLSNFASGAMLLIFRPYKIGDVVNIAGYLGKVFEIELFTTALDTFDHRRVIIPNSQIFGSVIENVTHHAIRRVEVEVGTAYAADVDTTREALERAIATVPEFVQEPDSAVVLSALGPSSVDWKVRAWATNDNFPAAKQALLRAVKIELDRAHIDIPFPQMDVTVKS